MVCKGVEAGRERATLVKQSPQKVSVPQPISTLPLGHPPPCHRQLQLVDVCSCCGCCRSCLLLMLLAVVAGSAACLPRLSHHQHFAVVNCCELQLLKLRSVCGLCVTAETAQQGLRDACNVAFQLHCSPLVRFAF